VLVVSLLVGLMALLALPSAALAQYPWRTGPQMVSTGLDRVFATANDNLDIDGLDDERVDVDVAVLDTGVQLDHPDLDIAGRTDCTDVSWPLDPEDPDFECTDSSPTDGEDSEGHGTDSAIDIGGLDNDIGMVGMAPGARIWPVDISGEERTEQFEGQTRLVLDLPTVIAGVKWVTAHADEIEVAHIVVICKPDGVAFTPSRPGLPPPPRCAQPEGVDLVDDFEAAIEASIAAGVVYVFSAGWYEADIFVPQNFDDMLIASSMFDSDGKPGSLGPAIGCDGGSDDHSSMRSTWGPYVDVASPGCPGSEASPMLTAAAAILASERQAATAGDDMDSVLDVRAIEDEIVAAGNDGWTDTNDSIHEPLLDVGDEQVFDPATVPGTVNGSGWDPDLQIRCAKSLGAPTANYYSDTTQCGTDGRNWSVFVTATNPTGSCPGTGTQAFPINPTTSPANLDWYQYWGSELGPNWTVNLAVDNIYTSESCVGPNTLTHLGIGRNIDFGGGPLPHPTTLTSSHQMAYGEWRPNGGSTRLAAAAVFRWGGKNHRIEVNLNTGAGTDNHSHPDVLEVTNNPSLERVVFDGAAIGLGVPSDYTSTTHQIQWNQLIQQAIGQGWLTAPPIDLTTRTTTQETLAVYISVETKGDELANLWTTSFRIAGK
jgi:hypothetical protein